MTLMLVFADVSMAINITKSWLERTDIS